MSAIILKVFLACGGVALLWNLAGKNARTLTRRALGAIFLKFPVIRKAVLANKGPINDILNAAVEGINDAEADAEAQNTNENKP